MNYNGIKAWKNILNQLNMELCKFILFCHFVDSSSAEV